MSINEPATDNDNATWYSPDGELEHLCMGCGKRLPVDFILDSCCFECADASIPLKDNR